MGYSGASIQSLEILAVNTEYSAAIANTGLLGAMTETGEDIRLAFASGQVVLAGGNFFWLFQGSVYLAENIDETDSFTLYAAKVAGTFSDWLKIEKWGGQWSQQNLINPETTKAIIPALMTPLSFSLTGLGRIAITTDSGEGFAYAFTSGQVEGAAGGNYGIVRQNGVWEIESLDPANTDTMYLAKRVGSSLDNFKIETWDVA